MRLLAQLRLELKKAISNIESKQKHLKKKSDTISGAGIESSKTLRI